MKKTVCVVLCLILLAFTAACKQEETTPAHDVDIAYFADMGALPESELKLGDAVPEEKEDDDSFFFTKAGSKSYASNGDFCYYYDENDGERKIGAIAAFSKCFGFDLGSISVEITEALDSLKIDYTSREPAEGEVFFLPENDNREVIVCNGLKNNLFFIFEDNALCATYLGDFNYGKDTDE